MDEYTGMMVYFTTVETKKGVKENATNHNNLQNPHSGPLSLDFPNFIQQIHKNVSEIYLRTVAAIILFAPET